MLTVNKLMPRGAGLAPVLLKRAATVELDWDVRQKSRFDATDSSGRALGIFLARGTVVRGGDVLEVEDGSLVRVIAAPQPVLRITHCTEHGTPFDLVRAAYHLGNRHVPIELNPDHLKIEPDHVLADMLRAMHLIVRADTTAFEPESGAYAAQGHAHGHAHGVPAGDAKESGHDHGHEHDHGHDPADANRHNHEHAHEHEHEHEHADEQGHDRVPGGKVDHDHGHGPSGDHADGHGHLAGRGHEHAHSHGRDHTGDHVHDDEHAHDHEHPHEDDRVNGQGPGPVAPHPHNHGDHPDGPGRHDGHKH